MSGDSAEDFLQRLEQLKQQAAVDSLNEEQYQRKIAHIDGIIADVQAAMADATPMPLIVERRDQGERADSYKNLIRGPN